MQPGLWASGCGRVKAGERAAGADGRCSWEPQGLRLLLLHALSRCHFLTGRGTFFEASIPDCSFNALAAAHASPAAAALLARVHSVVRPLGIPVHLNQIYANEVSLSAKYGLCRKGDCWDPFNIKSDSNKLTSERRGSSLFCSISCARNFPENWKVLGCSIKLSQQLWNPYSVFYLHSIIKNLNVTKNARHIS